MESFVAYYRVSTQRQGQSGLGLEAQQSAVSQYINATGGKLVEAYQEIESGRNNDRPKLRDALLTAKANKAKVVIAKLDRLGRRASYILRLIDESGVDFHICDMPDADKLTITILAAVAEREASDISKRTKVALAAKKARGAKLGNPRLEEARAKALKSNKIINTERQQRYKTIISEIITKGRVTTHKEIAECLNARGISTARGGRWHTTSVRRLIPFPVETFAESL
ncbi:MAG: recombinase family protein [Verrucomicrobiota bacterium]